MEHETGMLKLVQCMLWYICLGTKLHIEMNGCSWRVDASLWEGILHHEGGMLLCALTVLVVLVFWLFLFYENILGESIRPVALQKSADLSLKPVKDLLWIYYEHAFLTMVNEHHNYLHIHTP